MNLSSFEQNDLLWFWFVNIKQVGIITRQKLINAFGHPFSIYRLSDTQLSPFLNARQLEYFHKSKNMNAMAEGMRRLEQENTSFIHWESPEYPEKLRHLPDPPYGLYLRGRLPDPDCPAIALIGSRRATGYGRQTASAFAGRLARSGIQIISGLAEGIDTAGHKGALENGGYTLGIVGGGIDTIYPRENFNLYITMYEKGGVLSEWNVGVPNQSGLFPMRNRLISAFSDGIFVVEAAARSGTNITVDQALEQGKTVFALPGRITDINSKGTNQMIRDGAVPVLDPRDIVERLSLEGFRFEKNKNDRFQSLSAGLSRREKEDHSETSQKTDPDQNIILELLDEKDPVDFASLLRSTGYGIGRLSHLLHQLEISGKVIQPRQNVYIKVLSL